MVAGYDELVELEPLEPRDLQVDDKSPVFLKLSATAPVETSNFVS